MSRFKVTLSYNGSKYHGWQTQLKGNSIQEQVENVLASIQCEPCEVVASGRTDAKVHAIGQVFHFDSKLSMDAQSYQRAMNALLPKDIRIKKVELVNDEFHARFDAISKRYDYYLSSDMNNPFNHEFVGKESKQLDLDLMQQCAQLFVGTHDFTTFTSNRIHPQKSRVKTIITLNVDRYEDGVHFIFEGSGFLRYMVRMLVQTIIEVGKHTLTVEEVKMMLEAKSKHLCRFKAQPEGLYLVEVKYK